MWSSVLLSALLLTVPTAPAPQDEVRSALAVLHRWDASRSAAYLAGDAVGLRALYAPSSTAAAADVTLLRAYRSHGWRVTALSTQVRSIRVLDHRGGRWMVRIRDRVRGLVDTPQRCRALPVGPYRAHDLTLVRGTTDWVVARVRPAPSRESR